MDLVDRSSPAIICMNRCIVRVQYDVDTSMQGYLNTEPNLLSTPLTLFVPLPERIQPWKPLNYQIAG